MHLLQMQQVKVILAVPVVPSEKIRLILEAISLVDKCVPVPHHRDLIYFWFSDPITAPSQCEWIKIIAHMIRDETAAIGSLSFTGNLLSFSCTNKSAKVRGTCSIVSIPKWEKVHYEFS